MSKIEVKIRSDQGDLGIHQKYGALIPGTTIFIDEEDNSAELFEAAAEDKSSREADEHPEHTEEVAHE